jgi:ATP-dependent RNA helicase HelY
MTTTHHRSEGDASEVNLSPSERYARSKARAVHPALTDFEAQLRFPLDDFQRAACESLEAGQSVLVAAPTGAGKTVIAEFAISLAMRSLNERAFYTAPIKALSNQKFHELCERYGADQVGLLTGDTAINAGARIIVMTTEVLRNMLYAQSDGLNHLAFVVLDEVHYLADKFRGAVWEEIILHLPKSVKLVSLSATVSNAEEFGDWMHTVRGDTDVIVSEHRPVPLYQHLLTPGNFLPLFIGDHTGVDKRQAAINPEITRLARTARGASRYRQGSRGRGGSPSYQNRQISRSDIVRALERESLLPAIVFVFSRKGCDAAVASCVREGIRLVSQEERERIRSVALERTASINVEDLAALDFHTWISGLERGVAAHHAGMLPIFKEVVEDLFQQRLVKVVFATETLALGINMPARCVVIEKLDKFNGESRVQLTAGEFTQLTGRAGRRGIDHEGHSVVVWHDSMNPDELGQLASKRSYPLVSSFKPTYNMAVNLLDRFGYAKARSVLEMSFAQFQADRDTAELVWRVKSQEESLAGYEASMSCHLGDFKEYASIRALVRDIESGSRPSRARGKAKTAHDRKRMSSIQDLRARLSKHPCHRCEDREAHARWGERYTKLRRQTDSLQSKINQRTGSIARQFDRVTKLLTRIGYVKLDGNTPVIDGWGHDLKFVFGERDLLVIECIRQKIWDHLDPSSLAALIGTLVYEPRRDEEGQQYRLPRGAFREALSKTQAVWAHLDELEEEFSLPQSNPLSAAVAQALFDWSNNEHLDTVLNSAELTAGDFVRLSKQAIDLLDQIAAVAPEPLSDTAKRAKNLLKHGIVALSSVVA